MLAIVLAEIMLVILNLGCPASETIIVSQYSINTVIADMETDLGWSDCLSASAAGGRGGTADCRLFLFNPHVCRPKTTQRKSLHATEETM